MKKIMFVLALLVLAVPVWAATDVEITCEQIEPNEPNVAIGYIKTGDGHVRAFALDIVVTSPALILDVKCVSADYYIYPGSIDIDEDTGEVTDDGSCVCDDGDYPVDTLPGPPDSNGVTIEMGSLYDDVPPLDDPCHQTPPSDSGTLVILKVDSDCCITVTENILRGGIVLEEPQATPTLDLPDGNDCCVEGLACYFGMADYAQWQLVGEPECWCYPRQCHGDADGLPYGLPGYWVSIPDLTILKNAWNKPAAQLVGNEACADFDHLPYGLPNYRVSIPDLTILKANWNSSATPADCLPGNREP